MSEAFYPTRRTSIMARTFPTTRFGEAVIEECKYINGGLAVQLYCESEDHPGLREPLARLSMWLDDSSKLPPSCFFVKMYSENELIIDDAAKSGWFRPRYDMREKYSDPVWELLPRQGEGFTFQV